MLRQGQGNLQTCLASQPHRRPSAGTAARPLPCWAGGWRSTGRRRAGAAAARCFHADSEQCRCHRRRRSGQQASGRWGDRLGCGDGEDSQTPASMQEWVTGRHPDRPCHRPPHLVVPQLVAVAVHGAALQLLAALQARVRGAFRGAYRRRRAHLQAGELGKEAVHAPNRAHVAAPEATREDKAEKRGACEEAWAVVGQVEQGACRRSGRPFVPTNTAGHLQQ